MKARTAVPYPNVLGPTSLQRNVARLDLPYHLNYNLLLVKKHDFIIINIIINLKLLPYQRLA